VKKSPDKRVLRTRQALLDAFFHLVLTRPYEAITVQLIAARAGVGRSSLYEHFRGKSALLGASLAGPFRVLADAAGAADNTPALSALLEHFWANRARARGLFTGPMRAHAVAVLARLIQERWRASPGQRAALLLPPRLAALQLAEVLFAPVSAWLTTETECSVPRLTRALRRSALALNGALRAPLSEPQDAGFAATLARRKS
jgi:AcrR family transcriptional regulator